MSGAASGSRRNLVGWIRLDSNGNIIPGSVQYRPRGVQPKDGIWRQITSSYCCDCNCIITFRSTATVGDVTSIVSADSSIDWTGTLTDGDTISFVLPSCYNQVFTVSFGTITAGGIAISSSTVQGTGTSSLSAYYLAAGTGRSTTLTTIIGTCAQYLVTIVDD
jgi:hypothetical protein